MNNKLSAPYRFSEAPIVIPPKNTYGLILAPKPPKPIPIHECSPPGILMRLIVWIFGKGRIRVDSLYRCPSCGLVSKFRARSSIYGYWDLDDSYDYRYLKDWKNQGGLAEKD